MTHKVICQKYDDKIWQIQLNYFYELILGPPKKSNWNFTGHRTQKEPTGPPQDYRSFRHICMSNNKDACKDYFTHLFYEMTTTFPIIKLNKIWCMEITEFGFTKVANIKQTYLPQ